MAEQSGVIPYRIRDGRVEVLLITRRSGGWGVPKGHLEPGLTPLESAVQEAFEEAGVRGMPENQVIGSFQSGVHDIKLFLLQVTEQLEEFPEQRSRRREWLECEPAARRVEEQKLRKLLLAVPQMIGWQWRAQP